MAVGSLGSASFDLKADLSDLQAGFKRAGEEVRALQSKVSGGMQVVENSVKQSSRGAAMGLLQLGYAVDDLQYGFSAIVNNIPQLVYMMGGSAGIAGGVAIASVAINQLVQHWGYLKDVLQSNWAGSSLEQLTELRERAEKAAEAFDKLAKTPTKMQSEEGKLVAKAITEGPVKETLAAVADAVGRDPAMRAELTDADKRSLVRAKQIQKHQPAEAAARRADIAERLKAENEAKAKELLGAATLPGAEGDLARANLQRYAKANPAGFPEGFGAKLHDAKLGIDPEKQREFEQKGAREAEKLIEDQKKADADRIRKDVDAFAATKKETERQRKHDQMEQEHFARRMKVFNKQTAVDKIEDKIREAHDEMRMIGSGQKSSFFGLADFAKEIQTNALNNPAMQQVKLLELTVKNLEEIKRRLQKPEMPVLAVAGGPP